MFLRRDLAEVLVARRADEGKVAVALDHARHQELALAVDHLGAAFSLLIWSAPRATVLMRLPSTSTSPG